MLTVVKQADESVIHKFKWLNGFLEIQAQGRKVISWKAFYHNGKSISDPYRLSRMKQGVDKWMRQDLSK